MVFIGIFFITLDHNYRKNYFACRDDGNVSVINTYIYDMIRQAASAIIKSYRGSLKIKNADTTFN